MKRISCLLVGLAFVAGSLVNAADWPQFRGPKRDGVSAETGLLKTWPKGGPPLVWTFKNAGLGFASCAVVEETLYTLGTRDDQELVLALDAKKGTELWTAKLGPIFTFSSNTWGDGPRGTPTIDGNRLFALGGQGDLVCLDLTAQGKEVWRKNLIKDLGGVMMTEWGYSESPLVDGDKLLVSPGGPQGTVAALDKKSGSLLWQSTGLTNKAAYTSIIPAKLGGVSQYIQTSYINETQGGVISGFAADDGKVLWTEPLAKKMSYSIASSPIVVGDRVYVTEGNNYGCHLFQISAAGKAKDLYSKASQKVMKNNHGGIVLVGEHVYGFSEPGAWVCQDLKTGKEAWSERGTLGGSSGSICAADGQLYLYSDSGEVGLLAADPAEFKLQGTFSIPAKSTFPETRKTSRSSKVWSHPVVANGHLFLRDSELIFCYDVRDKK